jgi:hypothetical protein
MAKSYCILVPIRIFHRHYKWNPDRILVGADGQQYVGMYAPMIRGAICDKNEMRRIEATGKYVDLNTIQI